MLTIDVTASLKPQHPFTDDDLTDLVVPRMFREPWFKAAFCGIGLHHAPRRAPQ
jgi:hypothetical protein